MNHEGMVRLEYNNENIKLIQGFIDTAKKVITDGGNIVFHHKSPQQLEKLFEDHDISQTEIENAILGLAPEDYFRGINEWPVEENRYQTHNFNVCAFSCFVGKEKIQIYLKFGIDKEEIRIFIFSCHEPEREMILPFKN